MGRPNFDRDEWDPLVVVPRPPAVATMPPPVQGAALQQWCTTAMQAAGYVWEADHLRPLFWADAGDFNLPELVAATRWWFQLRPLVARAARWRVGHLGRAHGLFADATLDPSTTPPHHQGVTASVQPAPAPAGQTPPPGTRAMGPVAS